MAAAFSIHFNNKLLSGIVVELVPVRVLTIVVDLRANTIDPLLGKILCVLCALAWKIVFRFRGANPLFL